MTSTAAIASEAKLDEPERLEYFREIDSQLDSLGDAIDVAHLFITPEQTIALLDLRGNLMRIAHDYVFKEAAEALPLEAQRRVTTVIGPLRNQIRDRVAQLIRIADDSGLM